MGHSRWRSVPKRWEEQSVFIDLSTKDIFLFLQVHCRCVQAGCLSLSTSLGVRRAHLDPPRPPEGEGENGFRFNDGGETEMARRQERGRKEEKGDDEGDSRERTALEYGAENPLRRVKRLKTMRSDRHHHISTSSSSSNSNSNSNSSTRMITYLTKFLSNNIILIPRSIDGPPPGDSRSFCFLHNIKDPSNPSSACFSDVRWSASRGQFHSFLACSPPGEREMDGGDIRGKGRRGKDPDEKGGKDGEEKRGQQVKG